MNVPNNKRKKICKPLGSGVEEPVWYKNLSGVVIRPEQSRHKHRWSG